MQVRDATADDFPEMLRLAHQLWVDMDIPGAHGDWEITAESFFTNGLKDGSVKGFVVDHPSGQGLVSCGIGCLLKQMPTYWLPSGEMGFLQWFCTTPEFRRRGLATEILRRLVEWMESNGVTRVQLHASEEARSVYETAGFQNTRFANLWLRLGE